MKIAIGCDHAGYQYKEILKNYILSLGHEVSDFGCFSSEPVDYPEISLKVAKSVASQENDKGIVICGSGIGVSIVANKVKGIRCALVFNELMARSSREHNDANVLALGERILGIDVCKAIVEQWLNFDQELQPRHLKRISQIKELEEV